MSTQLSIATYAQVQIQYSQNVICYEQVQRPMGIRTFVLVCCQGRGYVVITRKLQGEGYVTLKRWVLPSGAGLSFHLPVEMSYTLDVRFLQEMITRNKSNPAGWTTIGNGSYDNTVTLVTDDNTET